MQTIPFGRRTLVILGAGEVQVTATLSGPFAMLLPMVPCPLYESGALRHLVETAVKVGCVEFCCMGPNAEDLHDRVDEVLEDAGRFEVVTTWHSDEPVEDSVYYFMKIAGASSPTLVALDLDSRLTSLLEAAAQST